MFYFPQQRRLIIKSPKANESRTKTFIDLVHDGYYQVNRYNSPAWTPTLSYLTAYSSFRSIGFNVFEESGEY